MRKVFSSTSEVCHIFAQRSQSEGKAGSVFFYGDKIYSYGYHYLLAEFHEVNGETVILINDKGYSTSTVKHIGKIISATSHYKQYFTSSHTLEPIYRSITEANQKLVKARKPINYINEIIHSYETLLASPFLTENDEQDPKFLAITQIYENVSKIDIQPYLAEIKAKEKIKQDAIALKLQENVKEFYEHEIDQIYGLDKVVMRVSLDKTNIETSKGVKIPINEAKELFTLIKTEKPIQGFKIGYYTVNGIQGPNLVVGCHTIPMKEILRVGNQL